MKRVVGLDSLRFVLAFAVLLGHLELKVLNFGESLTVKYKALAMANGLINNLSPGVAAVIAFFIISGFCIHYPYANGTVLNVPEFYAKRMVRIGLPAIVAVFLCTFTLNIVMVVMWSLICEVLYYFLYPLILKYKRRYFKQMLLASFICSYAISIAYRALHGDSNGDFHRSGTMLTWLVGLPIWLLGVHLADEFVAYKQSVKQPYKKLVALRLIVWGVAVIISAARFHAHIPYVYSLPVFSLLVYYWLKLEIWYYDGKVENKWLAYGGLMSYSIYLIHDLLIKSVKYILDMKEVESFWIWCLIIVVALLGSWVFYLLIEKKSHALAKSIKIKSPQLQVVG